MSKCFVAFPYLSENREKGEKEKDNTTQSLRLT